ncbi:unnamed protein product [Aureobasidium vineae]|uniref:Uncharacterized protein n=1 Tax=Aureobasidium vineae TaxID=2773715 RepID=A0A9N8PA16_9PEZI|nr:unnamed protein product [Aureobasidium vineae]
MNETDDDEGISLNDELYGNNNNNVTAVALANQEATWGFDGLGEDDNTTSVNTPAASDRPDVGSDVEDRSMDLDHDAFDNDDSMPPLMDDDQTQFDGAISSAHQDG